MFISARRLSVESCKRNLPTRRGHVALTSRQVTVTSSAHDARQQTPNEVHLSSPAANEQPRHEPHQRWPRGSPCAKPQVEVNGASGENRGAISRDICKKYKRPQASSGRLLANCQCCRRVGNRVIGPLFDADQISRTSKLLTFGFYYALSRLH